jgi:predicted dehydrogenase
MRLAIMSFAHLHAESYIGSLKAIPGAEFLGIADDDTERGAMFAERYGVRFFDSYDALFREKPDGVVICSENANHAPLVHMAAEAGVHVLCEKPLATTLEDGRAMIDVCQRNNVKLMTAFPMRFNAPIREGKAIIDRLGTIYGVNSTNQGECPYYHRAWFVDKKLAGGGAVMDHVVHLADVLRWYFGSEVTEVYAQTNHILYKNEAPDVETGGLVMLQFANGAFASIDCSWSRPPYYPTWGGLKLEIVGENGLATLDAFKQMMTVYSHSRQRPAYGYWGSDSDQAMVNEFAFAIRENREPAVTGWDGYRATEIALAAYHSAESGEPVLLG